MNLFEMRTKPAFHFSKRNINYKIIHTVILYFSNYKSCIWGSAAGLRPEQLMKGVSSSHPGQENHCCYTLRCTNGRGESVWARSLHAVAVLHPKPPASPRYQFSIAAVTGNVAHGKTELLTTLVTRLDLEPWAGVWKDWHGRETLAWQRQLQKHPVRCVTSATATSHQQLHLEMGIFAISIIWDPKVPKRSQRTRN